MFNLKFLSLLLFAFRIKFCFGSLELNNGVSKCSKEQFQCANGICIEKFKFCDYIVDCSDWSDEDTCASCDFEQNSMCGWIQPENQTKWFIEHHQYLTTGPSKDNHTVVKLFSSALPYYSQHCSLLLRYTTKFTIDKPLSTLTINASTNFGDMQKPFTLPNCRYDWCIGRVPIENKLSIDKPDLKMKIQLTASLANIGDYVRIKSIEFNECNHRRSFVDCNFDGGTFCNWKTSDKKSDLKWNIAKGNQLNVPYAPTVDHTTGKGSFIWTSKNNQTGNQAVMSIYNLDFPGCFSFWYYMDGSADSKIVIKSTSAASGRSYSQDILIKAGGIWSLKQFYSDTRFANYSIDLIGVPVDDNCVIALDDIRMNSDKCNDGTYTFESQSRKFSISKSGINSTWQVLSGQRVHEEVSSAQEVSDHTTNTPDGHFAVFVPYHQSDQSWLLFPEIQFDSYRCLQFYYIITNDDMAVLEVKYQNMFGHFDTKPYGYVRRSKTTHSRITTHLEWRQIQLTLDPLDLAKVEFSATATANFSDGFIGIDDVSIVNGKCREAVSCNFESGNCGWNPIDNAPEFIGEIVKPSMKRNSVCSGPDHDHTFESPNGHYMIFCLAPTAQVDKFLIKSVDFNSTNNYCFSFWAYFFNVTDNFIEVLDNNENSLLLVKGTNSSDWQYHEISVDSDESQESAFLQLFVYQISFPNGQGVAIDDIKLTLFKCDYDPSFHHHNHSEPKQKELKDFHCDFEFDLCNYVSIDKGISFKRTKAKNGDEFMPMDDHTTTSSEGHYIVLFPVDHPNNETIDPTLSDIAILKSKHIIRNDEFGNETITRVYVDFWYYMNGDAINSLNVSVMSINNNSIQTVFHEEGTFGPFWRRKRIPINFYEDFYLLLIGATSNSNGVLALDDISVFVGPPPVEDVCDFEVDACGWDNNSTLSSQWSIENGFILSFNQYNGTVLRDHTTDTQYGQFLYFNASDPSSEGQIGEMISPLHSPDKKCLQFWQYFYGENVGAIKVYIVYNELINLKFLLQSQSISDLADWTIVQVPIEKHFYDMDFQFVIELKRGLSVHSDFVVAIDDVSILDFCQPIGSCDFEEDFCTYANLNNTLHNTPIPNRIYVDSLWTRGTATDLEFLNIPTNDTHGYSTFTYLAYGHAGGIASPFLQLLDKKCLTFSYLVSMGQTTEFPKLSVMLAQLNSSMTYSYETLDVLGPNCSTSGQNKWITYSQTIDKIGDRVQLLFVGEIISTQLIALDNIRLTDGGCVTSKKFSCDLKPTSNTTFIDNSKVCNFYKDCPNGFDEQNCGYECSFNNRKLCNWTVHNVTSTFLAEDLKYPDKYFKTIDPVRDHTSTNDFNGTYLRLFDQPGPFVDDPEAIVESPWMQHSSPSCLFSFYFYMSDPLDQTGLIRVLLKELNDPLGIEIFRAEGDLGKSWNRADVMIGAVKGQFKIQVDARLSVKKGQGSIAIDDIWLNHNLCTLPTLSRPQDFECNSVNINKCDEPNLCYSDDMYCDFQEDCPQGEDELYFICQYELYRCDFEDGLCDWRIHSPLHHYRSFEVNGFELGPVDDFDDYPYAVKRDHTHNNQFGNVVYLWNRRRLIGQLEGPFIHFKTTCQLRFYYKYRSKFQSNSNVDTRDDIGNLRVYAEFKNGGTLFPYKSIYDVDSLHFEKVVVDFRQLREPFRVVIEIKPGNDIHGMWAIDDLSFSKGCMATPDSMIDPNTTYTPFNILTTAPNTHCKSDEFWCDLDTNKFTCLPKWKVCDFIPQCHDGNDERKCAYIEFGIGWTDVSEGFLSWNITEDNAKVLVNNEGLSDRAILRSALFGNSSDDCVMSFSYFTGDDLSQSLQLNLIWSNKSKVIQLFSTKSEPRNSWNLIKVYIGGHKSGWYLEFVAHSQMANNKHKNIILKNIMFDNCDIKENDYQNCTKKGFFTCNNKVCVPKDQICDYNDDCGDGSDEKDCSQRTSFRCNFEDTSQSMCGLNMTDNKWKRYAGRDTKGFLGPGLDHTIDDELGHFIMVTSAEFQVKDTESQFVSPMFMPDSSGDCFVRFWYMLQGGGSVKIFKHVDGQQHDQLLGTIDEPNEDFVWKRNAIVLVSKGVFSVAFEAKANNLSKTFFAIDDISFTKACVLKPHSRPTNCTDKQYQCQDGSCIQSEQVCDFYKNCPDGDDESTCPQQCDFESNKQPLCYWNVDGQGKNPVNILFSRETASTAKRMAMYYPPKDTSVGTVSGHYLLIYPAIQNEKVDNIDLNIYSPRFSYSTPFCTFSMDFYVGADKNGTTSEYSISVGDYYKNGTSYLELYDIDMKDEIKLNVWNSFKVGIGKRKTFLLRLKRNKNTEMMETLAIDNIRFDNCSFTPPHSPNAKACTKDQFTCGKFFNCIDIKLVCDLKDDCPFGEDEQNCLSSKKDFVTFENGTNLNGFKIGKPSKEDDPVWIVTNGVDPQRWMHHNGPPFDHTFFNQSGHFLCTKGNGNQNYGSESWLISPMIKSAESSQNCSIKFYYYLFGPNVYKLDVYIRNQTKSNMVLLRTFQNDKRDEWLEATVPLQSEHSEFEVILSSVSGGKVGDSIAVDDIILSSECVVDHSGTTLPNEVTTLTPTTHTATPTINPTSKNPPICEQEFLYCFADKVCLPPYTQCNFQHDCDDDLDERMCTKESCSFETPTFTEDCGLYVFNTPSPSKSHNAQYAWRRAVNQNKSIVIDGFNITTSLKYFLYVDSHMGDIEDYTELKTKMISETNVECLLMFHYKCDLDNCPLEVSIISHLSNKTEINIVWMPLDEEIVGFKRGNALNKAEVYIGQRRNIEISIGSRKSKHFQDYILISNVQFQNCEPPRYNLTAISLMTCPKKQFKCHKSFGNCVNESAICDLENDCWLGEDEANCDNYVGMCDFEDLMFCNYWTFVERDDRLAFHSETGMHGLSYLPRTDHTYHSEHHYYISYYLNTLPNYLNSTYEDFSGQLESNAIFGNVSTNCSLRLWYNIIGSHCSLTIYKKFANGQRLQVHKLSSKFFDVWKKVEVQLGEVSAVQDFSVLLVARAERNKLCSVNVDDISLTPECTSKQVPIVPVPDNNDPFNLCKPNFMCHNKQCYNATERCNFIDDCGDASDEEMCPAESNFETNFDGWFVPKGYLANFTRHHGSSPNRAKGGSGPSADHTFGTVNGTYLLLVNDTRPNTKVLLHSEYFSSSGSKCRFSFAYFLNDTSQLMTINLYKKINTNPPKLSKLWALDSTKSHPNKWNEDEVYLGQLQGFSLMFEVIQGSKVNPNDLAFDDFVFDNCVPKGSDQVICNENEYRCDDHQQCIHYWQYCDGNVDCDDNSDEVKHCTQANGTCWFVNQNWRTHCSWIDLDGDLRWTFTTNTDINTGPQSLYNGVYGYLLMVSKGHVLGEKALIATQVFPASIDICSMDFHYYMYGSDSMGDLNVYTLGSDGNRRDFFSTNGNQGRQWNTVENLLVGNTKPFRVVFEGIVGGDRYSDIAIAYVSFARDCAAGNWTSKKVDWNQLPSCNGFLCTNTTDCISIDWVCDGQNDCDNGSDESNCESKHPANKNPLKKALVVTTAIFIIIVTLLGFGYTVFKQRARRANYPIENIMLFDNNYFGSTLQRDLHKDVRRADIELQTRNVQSN